MKIVPMLLVALAICCRPMVALAEAFAHDSYLVAYAAAGDGHDHSKDGHSKDGAKDGAKDDHGETEKTAPLPIDPDLAIFTFIVFAVLFLVLAKFAWGPIVAGLEKREHGIAHEIEEARRSNEEARHLLAQYETKLSGAAAEVRGLIDQAKKDAETHKQTVVAEAQKMAEAERTRAVREITAAKNVAINELAQKTVDTATEMASKVIRRQLSLTPEDKTNLISESLAKLPSSN